MVDEYRQRCHRPAARPNPQFSTIPYNFSQFLTIYHNFQHFFINNFQQFFVISHYLSSFLIISYNIHFYIKNGQKMLLTKNASSFRFLFFQKDGFLPSFFFFHFIFKRDFHFIFQQFPLMLFHFTFPSFPYPQKKSLDQRSKDPRFFHPFLLMPSHFENRTFYSSSWPIRPRSEQLFSNTIQYTIQICQQFCPNVASKNVLTLPAILSQKPKCRSQQFCPLAPSKNVPKINLS